MLSYQRTERREDDLWGTTLIMGVKLLTTYVNSNKKTLYQDFVTLEGSHLVFDGNALQWKLLRLTKMNQLSGGDYKQLFDTFVEFFRKLKKLGVVAYLVMDGGLNIPLKIEATCQRKVNQIKTVQRLNDGEVPSHAPRPLFCELVFMEALRHENVKFVVAKHEADILVAAVANKLGCPVVFGDSDFFLLDLQHGLISLDTLLEVLPIKRTKCERYHRDNLLSYLKIDKSLIHALAILMGNDYSVTGTLIKWRESGGIYERCSGKNVNEQVRDIAKYLRQYNNVEQFIAALCIENEDSKIQLHKELQEYDVTSSLVTNECEELCQSLKAPNTLSQIFAFPLLRERVEHLTRYGYLSAMGIDIIGSGIHFTDVQCENVRQKSSSSASEKLRIFIYQLLISFCSNHVLNQTCSIEEYARVDREYRSISVPVKKNPDLSLDMVLPTTSIKDKKANMLRLANFPEELYKSLNDEDAALFILSAYYWTHLTENYPTIKHVKALLGAYLACRKSEHTVIRGSLITSGVHQLCAFQSILFYMNFLNTIFGYPFINKSVCHMISGSRFCHMFKMLEKGVPVKDLIPVSDMEKFDGYFHILTSDINERFQPKPLQKTKANEKTEKVKSNQSKSVMGSRFAGLLIEGESEDDAESDQ